MEQTMATVLINGGLLLFMWGMVWRSNNQRLDKIEASARGVVPKEYCRLQHAEIKEDFVELKKGQKELLAALRDIEGRLSSRDNAARLAAAERGKS